MLGIGAATVGSGIGVAIGFGTVELALVSIGVVGELGAGFSVSGAEGAEPTGEVGLVGFEVFVSSGI